MLEFERHRAIRDASEHQGARHESRFADPFALLLALRRDTAKLLLVVGCFCLLGLGYVYTAVPLYTATSDILVDARLTQADDGEGGNKSLAELGMDATSIDSQVAVLMSQKLAIAVLKRLHLENDEEFAAPATLPAAMFAALRRSFGSPRTEATDGIRADILDGFSKSVAVTRVQQTYVMKVSFTARSPQEAAIIANALVSAYSDAEIRSRMRARQISNRFVQQRMDEVRARITSATSALAQVESRGDARAAGVVRRDLDGLQASYAALAAQADGALQHQVTPISAVTVLAEARPPERKSQPNTLLVLLLSAVAGLASAIGLIVYDGLLDGSYGLPGQVEAALGLAYVGLFPMTEEQGSLMQRLGSAAARFGRSRSAPPATNRRTPSPSDDTLRAMTIAADMSTHNDDLAIVGIVSTLRGEGRSSIAAAFADRIAEAGQRSLLVDADLRHPALSRRLAPHGRAGLIDVSIGRADLSAAVVIRGGKRADFLPACSGDSEDGAAVLQLKGLQALLAAARPSYDFVVLDLPPIGAFSEVAALAPAIGVFFLVIEWGVTARDMVDAVVADTPLLAERTAGFVFSKVDVAAFRKRASGSGTTAGTRRPRAAARFS